MPSSKEHWDSIFTRQKDSALGWYEESACQTMELLEQVPGWEQSTIFLPGAGTSILVEELLSCSVGQLIANDISQKALDTLKDRLGVKGKNITYLCQDIVQPIPSLVPAIDIWIDRAVLHFLIDEDAITKYFNNLFLSLNPGGFALFAEFSRIGATKCAGLPLHRYSVEELSARLGASFSLISQQDYTYINPNGDPRPYIYALFRRAA